jgi:hypothetical protein
MQNMYLLGGKHEELSPCAWPGKANFVVARVAQHGLSAAAGNRSE